MFDLIHYAISGSLWRFLGFAIILTMLLKAVIALVAILLNRDVEIK